MLYVTRKHEKTLNIHLPSWAALMLIIMKIPLRKAYWTQTGTFYYNTLDPDVAWSIIKNIILTNIDLICPKRTFHIRLLKDPWITNEILEGVKDKDVVLARAKRTNAVSDWIVARRG